MVCSQFTFSASILIVYASPSLSPGRSQLCSQDRRVKQGKQFEIGSECVLSLYLTRVKVRVSVRVRVRVRLRVRVRVCGRVSRTTLG